MSSNLAAGKTLEVIDRLRSTVEGFASRAEKLDADYRLRSAKERTRCTAALEEHTRGLASRTAEVQGKLEAARQRAQLHYEQRRARISRAYQNSKEQRLKKIDDSVGARRYDAQRRTLQAERDRDSALTAATARFEQFKKDLAVENTNLAQLEHSVQKAFAGYSGLRKRFFKAYEEAQAPKCDSEDEMLGTLRRLLQEGRQGLTKLRSAFLFRLFRYVPVWFALGLLVPGAVPLLEQTGQKGLTYPIAAAITVGIWLLAVAMHALAAKQAGRAAESVSGALATARHVHDACAAQAESHWHAEHARIKDNFVSTTQETEQKLKQAMSAASQDRVACRMNADERTVRTTARHEEISKERTKRLERHYADALEELKRAGESNGQAISVESERNLARMRASYEEEGTALKAEWTQAVQPLFKHLQETKETAARLFPAWEALVSPDWKRSQEFIRAAKFATLKADLEQLSAGGLHAQLPVPGERQMQVPVCLAYPDQGSILFETNTAGPGQTASVAKTAPGDKDAKAAQEDRTAVVGALNAIILRLLSVAPPGRVIFTVLDPVGLGQNFAGVMHMADYEEQIISSRIWTQSGQIEEKLGELNEHMEKVIQMYLRNEYQTIAEYNEQAGVIAEKYHFLVVADFPANFTDTAARRLLSIAASGAKCGVYTLIHWDHRHALPQDFIPDELRKNSVCVKAQGGRFLVVGKNIPGTELLLDEPPSAEVATQLVHQIGEASRDSSRVEVPFHHVAPSEAEMWTEDTTSELQVPVGRTGATKLQYLAIGKGTRQHALIAGKTGSGKSTLFHVMITNLAMWCSPEQVEFYLVDFKKGVEFKCYASRRLPHARVVAIESDREFGLSVLQRVDDELKRRGDLFRKLGVQDIPGYKRAGGTESVPRSLLIIDEFQEFFVEDDKIAQTASLLLDRIVRQGRAFGIHVLLGSQTLGGAYTVARTTLGQMVIRIALQCNEADAFLIMDDNNPAPRLLSRPGEGIYNDAAGAIEGNSPFQVVWLPEQVRDASLNKVRERADRENGKYPGPIVFEGNAPADVQENTALSRLLSSDTAANPAAPRIWMGAPNSIKGPTEAIFYRQSGNNLLVVGQRDEAILATLSVGLISLASQFTPDRARIILADSNPPGSPARDYLEQVLKVLPPGITLAKPGDVPAILAELTQEMNRRVEENLGDEAPPVFFFLHGIQRFARLRYEDDFSFSSESSGANPSAQFNSLVSEGARVGIHVIVTCDTYNNVNRFFSRKSLTEFEMRVLFQMSTNDSASLIDNPKAGMLGLHRALFYNAQEGYLETFRPYALPPQEWVEACGSKIARLTRAPLPS